MILICIFLLMTLYQEIDYFNEGRNADKFRMSFRNVKWVRVPLVYWDYTTTNVLVLEYLPGIKINQLDKMNLRRCNRSLVAKRIVEAYLIQVLETGLFHADPHPGNLAIDNDEAIIYYDFGMMGEIKTTTRQRLLDLFYAVYEKDTQKVVNSLINLGALQSTGDLSTTRNQAMLMPHRVHRIEKFVNQLESGDLKLRVRVLEVYFLLKNFFLKFSRIMLD
uniref:ABC1 atypical kinase-like domain-containing protein n=1 Tax=Opuntia streptacantha TaxID=393608 RepID=A0A7C9DI16_OPUST